MSTFLIVDKKSLNEVSVDASNINLKAPSTVHTKLYRDDVSEFIQDGSDLILKLKNGKTIVIANFFTKKDDEESELIFEDEDCGIPWLPLLLGAGGAGAIAALVNDNDSDNTGHNKNTPPTISTGKDQQAITTVEDMPHTGNITDVRDPDGDQLTYTVTEQPKNGTVTINEKTGEYTYTPNPGYNGDDSFTVTVDDGRGGNVVVEVPVTVTPVEDNIPAATVTVTGYEDNVEGGIEGNVASGLSTNDNKPVISGSATGASKVEVTIVDSKGQVIVKTATVENGKWTLPELTETLADGKVTITATATNGAGKEVVSNEYTVTVDTQVDAGQPEIITGTDGSSTITTTVPKDVDNTGIKVIDPKTGEEIPGLTVKGPDADGKVVIEGKIPADVVPELKVTDKTGNETTTPITDKTPAATVTVTGYEDNVEGGIEGNVASGLSTNDNKPVISGSATGASKVEVTIVDSKGQVIVKTATVENGKWTLPELTETLADGQVTITATATNGAGKEVVSNEYTVTVDTQVDAGQPEIITGTDGSSTITTTVPKDVETAGIKVIDPKTGEEIPGLTVKGPDADGKVVIEGKIPTDVVPELKVTDKTGNETTTPITDKTPAATVTVTGYEDNVEGGIEGNVASGLSTNDNKPVISGSATGASKVEVTIVDSKGQVIVKTATVENGKWTLPELTETLADGQVTITATATNGTGKEVVSNEYTVTVDTQVDAGQPEIVTSTDGSSTITTTVPKDVETAGIQVIDPKTGEEIPGLTVKGPDADGKVVIEGKIPTDVVPELKVTDKTGNETTTPITDKTPAATVTVTGYEDNVEGGIEGNVASGESTNDNKPVISGSATGASKVEVTIVDSKGQVIIKTATVENGKWTLPELTETLADGQVTITATATNGAGKEVVSNEYTVTVDTQVDAGQPEIITGTDGSSTITTTVPKDVETAGIQVIDPKTGEEIPGLTVKGPDADGKVVIEGKIPTDVVPELKVTDKTGNETTTL